MEITDVPALGGTRPDSVRNGVSGGEESPAGMRGVGRLISERRRRHTDARRGLEQLFTTVMNPLTGPFLWQRPNTDTSHQIPLLCL